MAPELRQTASAPSTDSTPDDPSPVTGECLLIRSYDGRRQHQVTVRLHDTEDEIAFQGNYTVPPLGVVAVRECIDRGVYGVDVSIDGDTGASADCLVGSDPTETALVEFGNGLVSVSEGVV